MLQKLPLSSGGAALKTVCQKGPPLHLRSGEAPYLGTTSGLLPSIAYRAIQVPDDCIMGHRTGKREPSFRDHTTANTAQFLLYFLAADLISAWPAPIRQPTPTPPKVAPANFAADQSSPPTTSSTPLRGRGRRAIVRPDSQGQRFEPPPERRTFKSERPAAIPIRQIAWNGRTIRHKSKNR